MKERTTIILEDEGIMPPVNGELLDYIPKIMLWYFIFEGTAVSEQ